MNMLYVVQNLHLFLLLIGPLVFFHELGHFLVAKWCHVKVLKFSLGFGPRLIGFVKGETTYVISLIPLGGYVKMLGENPDEHVAIEDRHRTFQAQKMYRRAAIVIAGPLANMLLAWVVYLGLSLAPQTDAPAQIGIVLSQGAADKAGLLAQDVILSVNHQPIQYWSQLQRIIQQSTSPVWLQVKRGDRIFELSVQPEVVLEPDELGQKKNQGKLGISLSYLRAVVDVSDMQSPAYLAGLRTGDEITRINDVSVDSFESLSKALKHVLMAQPQANTHIRVHYRRYHLGAPIKDLDIAQKQEETSTTLVWSVGRSMPTEHLKDAHVRAEPAEVYLGFYSYDARVAKVAPGSVAEKTGLLVGDRLLFVNQKPVHSFWFDLAALNASTSVQNVDLVIQRGNEIKTLHAQWQVAAMSDEFKSTRSVHYFGAENDVHGMATPSVKYQLSWLRAVSLSFHKLYDMTALTLRGLYYLVSGRIALSQVGGPVMLFVVAEKTAQFGVAAFMSAMAVISINLGVMNLLPVPVLDGGHLMFMLLALFKRQEISDAYKMHAIRVGFVLLMALMVLAFHNDIVRFILG